MTEASPIIEEYKIRSNYTELDDKRPGLVSELEEFVGSVYSNVTTEELLRMLSMRQVLIARSGGADGDVVAVTTTDVDTPANAYMEPRLPARSTGLYLGLAAISPRQDQRLYERLTIKRFDIARASVMPRVFTKTAVVDEFNRLDGFLHELDYVVRVTKLSQFVIAPEFSVVENPPDQTVFDGNNDVVSVWDIDHK